MLVTLFIEGLVGGYVCEVELMLVTLFIEGLVGGYVCEV